MNTTKIMLTVAVLLSAGCRSAPKPELKPGTIGWRPMGTWTGHGDEQTDSFDIGSGQFRVKWETRNEKPPGSGTFRAMVHSGVSGRPLALAVEHKGIGTGTAYINDDPRPFYLVIESSNVDWSVKVEEAVAAPAESH